MEMEESHRSDSRALGWRFEDPDDRLQDGRVGAFGELLDEEPVAAEAGVALAAVRVQDPQRRSPARWAGPIAGDDHLRSLADHVPAEPDPRSTGQLQPDPGRLADGCREPPPAFVPRPAARYRRLEHDERDPGTARERGQAPEPIGESRRGRRRRAGRQVDDQQVHRPAGQQRAGDRQALLGVGRASGRRATPAGSRERPPRPGRAPR